MVCCDIAQPPQWPPSPLLSRERPCTRLTDTPTSFVLKKIGNSSSMSRPNSISAPQLMTVMSPKEDLSDLYGMVTWNYREIPSFNSGGLQLQSWADDLFLYSKNFREGEFSTKGETISWTQSLKVTNNILTLRIKNGESETWGSFGGTEMQLSELILVNNLNNYSPETSVENSAVTYGSYRVVKLRIKEVRYYDANNNLISTDGTSRVVHQRPSN